MTPGWFGKLPMLGDFAHRRLPLPVVAACDAWLAQSVAASRTALGEAWLDTYLHAPLWGFAWAPGVVDAQWWRGVMMPSVDAAGRYFPLLAMQSAASAPTPSAALARWYEALAGCTLATLGGQVTLAAFEDSLAQIDGPADDDEITLPQSPHATIEALRGLDARLAGHSTWWPLADEITTTHVWPGLPPADRFTALLQGPQAT